MNQALAVIGMACRLPGGIDTPAQFWELLRSGGEVVGDLPPDRWDIHAWYHPDPARPGKTYASKGGFRKDVDLFDAEFFGISPREASRMDPQQRLLLEMTWEALEDAGQVPEALAGSDAAVIFGLSSLDYQNLQLLDPESVNAYSNLGSAACIAANRVSYFFDFRGPSFILDTACSSSLVALHTACEAIWSGRSRLAVTGGANVLLSPFPWVGGSKALMLSPAGRCRAFDAGADGYVRSEGGGVLVIKPLDRAQADGDPIRAVILASGTNCDGRTQGLFLPSAAAQEALLGEIYARAGIEPAGVDYVEAHGTGTAAGDPIECEALGAVLGSRRSEPLPVGSVKTNLGHLEAAAGVVGAMKVILSLQHRKIPPSLHFETPNPRIPFAERNLEVVTRLTSLAGRPTPLVMGVNSFGFGGANAHVVCAEYRQPAAESAGEDTAGAPDTLPLFLSARSPEALRATAANHARYLAEPARSPLYDICYTAAIRRGRHAHRLAAFASSAEEFARQLAAFAEGREAEGVVSEKALPGGVRPVFVFSGNGSQWTGMGRELMRQSPVFRQTVERADGEFAPLAGWSLAAALLDPDGDDRMALTQVAQPLLFAVQAGLVGLLAAYGLSPEAVVGHSVGEVAAAWTAGIYSLEQAVRVIYARSHAQARTAGTGKMAACGLSADQAAAALARFGGALEVASINSPSNTTLSGDAAALAELGAELERQGVFFRMLDLDYPFHSHLMDEVREPLLEGLERLRPARPRIRFVSTTTGGDLDGAGMGAEYWWDNVRRPVLFSQALELLIRDGYSLFVEVGPHPVLDTYIRQCLEAGNALGRAVETLRRRQPEMPRVLSAIGRCHASGCELDMRAIFPRLARPAALPLYPWQRERHWNGGIFAPPGLARVEFQHPLLGYRTMSADPLWESEIDLAGFAYLADHRVLGAAVFPMAGFLEMALRAAELFRGTPAADIEDIEIRKPLSLADGRCARVQFSICSEDGAFRIRSRGPDDAAWALEATGRLPVPAERLRPATVLLDQLRDRLPGHLTGRDFYRLCAGRGLEYGPAFRRIEELWVGAGEALGKLTSEIAAGHQDYSFHPALLDACLQVSAAACFATGPDGDDALYLPAQIRRFRLFSEGRTAAFCHARVERRSARSVVLYIQVFDAEGATVAEVEGFRVRRVESATVRSSTLPMLDIRAVLRPGAWERHAAPVELPDPGSFAQAVAERLAPPVDGADPRIVRAWADQVCGLFAWEALEALGAAGGAFDIASLAARGAVAPDRMPLLGRLVGMAGEDGFLRRNGEKWVFDASRPDRSAVEVWRRGVADFPAYLAESCLLGRCGASLARLLRGETAPLEAIFPEGGAPAVEHLSDQAPSARAAYSMVRAAMAEVVGHWPGDRILRVLEIGGEAGPVAPHILPLAPPDRTEYRFARDLTGGELEERGFDVVVAAGAFHAAPDPAEALRRARELVRGGGLFILVEPQPQRFFDLTFGLVLPAWRLLDGDQWVHLLQQSGFEHAAALGQPQEGLAASSVVIAWNPPAEAMEAPAPSEPGRKRTWMVLRDAEPDWLIERLAERLAQAGHRVIEVFPGAAYERRGPHRVVAPRDDPETFRRLFLDLAGEGIHCDELIHGWGLGLKPPETAAELAEFTDRRSVSTLSLVQGLTRTGFPELPRLWLLTRGAMPVSPAAGELIPAHGSLWGLGRVVAHEIPALSSKLVDLHWVNSPSTVLDRLMAEFDEKGDEDEIILTERARYVHRVCRSSLGECAAADRAPEKEAGFRLALARTGSLDNLILEPCERPAPGPGQVEIRVRAAGLNFHDLVWAMGWLPDEAVETGFAGPTLGLECAGEVVRVGAGVSEFRPGDAVMASASQCFSAYVVADAASVVPKPAGIACEAAATVLAVFTTVVYALEHLGRMQPGERVLIHGAAGGVGLAAIQYAMHVGAEVFATAGTEEKREYLRLLGVRHVFSSRTQDYAGQILRVTSGEGVDLVLNTLAGEAVARSFSVLRPFGRFLELGKKDFLEHNRMAMAPFRNNLSYFGIDVDQALALGPGFREKVLPRVLELVSRGALRPLPFRAFPVSRAREAFRHMQKSQHIGKIVIRFDDEDVRVWPGESAVLPLRPDGTYLLTGGLSGLGLETARWMARRGARHLVLVSRGGAAAPEAAAAVAELRAAGCQVLAASADVADEGALGRVLADISRGCPPLRGVVHAAMVLDDVMTSAMTPERFWRAARPKILGAWNLHRLTLGAPLEFFVLYSSVALALGNPGQANYLAGNAFLESLAHYRRRLGLPGTAIAWGAISDAGYLARNPGVLDTLETRLALHPLSARQALRYLEQILGRNRPHWIAAEVNWPKLASTFAAVARSPRFTSLIEQEPATAAAGAGEDVRALLRTLPPDEMRQAVTDMLVKELARVLRGATARVDPDRPLAEHGVDSLMAVELLTAVETRFHVQITPLEIMAGAGISQIAGRIVASLVAERGAQPART